MTAASIGNVLSTRYNPNGTRKRGESKVRRHSFDVDDERAKPHSPIGDGSVADGCRWRDSFMRSVEDWNIQYRIRGKGVPLPGGAMRVLRAMLFSNQLDFRTGELTPALNLIAKIAGCTKDTVVRSLARFRYFGILDHVRRTRKTGYAPDEGPAREQETNAYYFPLGRLPARLRARFLERLRYQRNKASGRKPPVTLTARVEETAAQYRSMPRGTPERTVQDSLDRLAKAFDRRECESDSRSVCPSENIIQKE